MNLVQVTYDSIAIGQPLPFSLRDETGTLLARKGFVIGSRADLEAMRGRGHGFYVDVSESERHQKAFVGKLLGLVREDRPLGKIAQANLTTRDLDANRIDAQSDGPNWLDLQVQGNRLLRDLHSDNFGEELDRLQSRLDRFTHANPDGALFALFHLSSSEITLYSATHAMLVCVMCALASREVLRWPPEQEARLCKAALTMNLGMTALQDRLAAQNEAPTAAQRELIAAHAERSVELLMALGIQDDDWLAAVRDHHSTGPGALQPRAISQRFARLIQRADAFAAQLAPRASRRPTSAKTAMQACYFDENRQMDEAGAALIKAVGVYSPGSLVRLANNEVGVVVRRGANTTTPRVAVLVNRDGIASAEHMLRDTSLREFRIASSVPRQDCKVHINLDRLLALTGGVASSRFW